MTDLTKHPYELNSRPHVLWGQAELRGPEPGGLIGEGIFIYQGGSSYSC